MKKNFFMLAATAALFAACAETDLVNEVNTVAEPQAIGFETFANKVTRASSATTLNTYHETFGVWAYKTPEGGSRSTVMDNFEVVHNGANRPAWKYEGHGVSNQQQLKYWDKLADYEFFAYAPYRVSNVTIENDDVKIDGGQYAANENLQETLSKSQNTKVFSGNGDPSSIKSTDWMIAAKVTADGASKTIVEEIFKHTMSKLTVILKSTVANTEIISASVNNVYGTGSYAQGKWTKSGDAVSVSGATGVMVEKGENYYAMEYLLIPSEEAPTFSIKYQVNGDTYEQKNVYIYGIDKFVANTSYTLTVTIDLAAIQFNASNVDWTPDNNGNATID